MNFDNLMQYDLMSALYRFIPFLLILLIWIWLYSEHCVIQCVREFEIHSVETVRQTSSVKKRDQKVKRI